MTLSEYVEITRRELVEFQYWFLDQGLEKFPGELEVGEWQEQFLAWVSLQEGGGDDSS